MTNKKIILRLCRNYPRVEHQGIGLHAYFYTQYSQFATVVVSKFSNSTLISGRSDTVVHEISYSDLAATKSNLGVAKFILIGLSKVFGEAAFLFGTLKFLRGKEFNIAAVHVHSINYLFAGIALKHIRKVPLFLNFGGTDLLRAKNIWLYKLGLKQIDAGFYVSKSMEADLAKILAPGQFVYTSNGFNTDLFQAGSQTESRQLIAVGNLRWQKDYLTMVRAFKIVSEKFPDYSLEIYGTGPDKVAIENELKLLGLQGRVHLRGAAAQKEISEQLQNSQVYLISSQSEGFPKALVEAMASGLPVVATDVGDCKEVARGCGLIVPSGSPEKFAEALEKILENDDMRSGFRKASIERARKYSWNNVSEVVEKTYERFGL